ncbi:family 3 glycoside hydrolase [Cryphonectria parasitica EP155]|uniref:Beta-glucosidase cel3A n=1 Tax=Cryphonectria parasitica (strain ATCC 38755 / EP155) TaxID=660469 RepID=A0A9P4Y7T3_CRYP1|nr:family 3 glycoside hydrolase [Cryphonectria parasitica EP155]KAF3767937.1 family 3 glycoside hydrolase [Cryphonectria parasitica EP155]
MASSAAALLLSALLVPAVKADTVFSHVQPLNTTILGQYGFSDPVYPSPNTTGAGGWEAALAKAQAFVAELTIEEKAQMVTGVAGPCVGNILAIERLGFPGLCLQDGPLAIRVASYASVFSAGVSAAATWDRDIMYERGHAMGEEFRGKGAHIYLGPVAGPLGRSGYAGRNWEGFAADPYLTGVAMEETITGMQDTGVQSCAKHFVAYEQETQRNPTYPYITEDDSSISVTEVTQESVSSNVDDRTLHELYVWPFANAVHAGVSSLMCSYNRINGSYACQNSKTQNGILKSELGFQGYVMSDWGGTHSGLASIEAGLDMDMPGTVGYYGMDFAGGSFFGGNVTAAVNNGSLDVARVDDMITRIMTPYYFHGQDSGYPGVDPAGGQLNTFSPESTWKYTFNMTGTPNVDVRGNHSELIRKHGAAGTVLLKNTNNALPLKAPKLIALFGNDASAPTEGMYTSGATFYGNQYVGGGSGTGRATFVSTPLDAIVERASQDNAYVQFFLNNTLVVDSEMPSLWIPAEPDVCLVFVKTYAEEGADRTTLDLDWEGSEMVTSVAKYCSNTVVVSHSSGINVLPFADNPNVTAILAAHYPGEESGHSIVDILYGDVNPSGHLPYTIAYNSSDYNAPPTTAVQTNGTEDWQVWFDEGLEIDYRYFDANNISVRYEFGFGLSYTTFELANIAAEALGSDFTAAPPAEEIQPGGNPALWETLYNVTVSLSNTGSVEGAAVPQLYVTFPDSAPAGTPPKQLRGFDKITLAPNQTATASFELMRRDISYWDVLSQDWVIPSGDITVSLGFSSRDLRVSTTITPVAA